MSATMWAIVYHRYGGPEVLQREEVPVPALGQGDVLVRPVASGVSRVDALYRAGTVRLHGVGFPKQTGFDALGQVVDSRDPSFPVGTWVWSVLGLEPLSRRGTAVEQLRIDRDRLGKFPDGFVPDIAVGALTLGALTALVSLRDRLRVLPGHRVLVVGAGGAVGVAALQLGRLLGARVDAVTGAASVGICTDLRAERVVDYHDSEATSQLLDGGYDRVLIAAGPGKRWLSAVRPGGRVVFTAIDAWAKALPGWRGRKVTLSPVAAGHSATDLTWLAERVADGQLRPVVGRRYSIDRISDAHRDLGAPGTCGGRLIVHA